MTDYREKDYTKEIRFKGVETLNKFLLLLKEERNVVKRKEKGLEILRDNDKDFLEEYVEKMSTDEALKGEEFSVDPEKFFLVKEKLKDLGKLSDSQLLASNAYFVYLFALFDQFILEIATLTLKNNSSIMENYKNYCISYFESGKDKYLYKLLAFEDKLIDYLKNFSSPITVITNIFGIDFKKEKYIEHYFNFIEMKERRNLIVHRGGKSDEIYLKTIKKYLSKFPQKNLNNFLNELEKDKGQFLNIDQKYFLKTIETFYFLVCLIVNKVLPKNDSNKKITLFTDPFNELFNFTLENKLELLLIPTAKQLFSTYISEDLGNDLSKMEDKSKVNLILCNQQLKEFSTYIADSAKKRGLENKKSTIVIQRFEEYNNHLIEKIEDKLIKKIIISFLEKNYHKFTESIFSYVERESIYPRQIESNWYMFKKLSLDDNFRKIYYPFKEKNNLKIEEIKVSLSKDVIAKIKKRKN